VVDADVEALQLGLRAVLNTIGRVAEEISRGLVDIAGVQIGLAADRGASPPAGTRGLRRHRHRRSRHLCDLRTLLSLRGLKRLNLRLQRLDLCAQLSDVVSGGRRLGESRSSGQNGAREQ
jgi:hypothetical protein